MSSVLVTVYLSVIYKYWTPIKFVSVKALALGYIATVASRFRAGKEWVIMSYKGYTRSACFKGRGVLNDINIIQIGRGVQRNGFAEGANNRIAGTE